VVALAEALGEEAPERLRTPPYQPMKSSMEA